MKDCDFFHLIFFLTQKPDAWLCLLNESNKLQNVDVTYVSDTLLAFSAISAKKR